MNIYDFLQSLTIKERGKLANEIETTAGYLNYLASKREFLSITMASRIFESGFNKRQPCDLSVTSDDYFDFKREKIEEKLSRNDKQ